HQPVDQPLVLHWLDDNDTGTVGELRNQALHACADQITHLLDKQPWRIAGKPVRPADIAVLLPGNNEVQQLARLLTTRHVPCVTSSRNRTVFQSDMAHELRIVLHAAWHAGHPDLLRAALGTRLRGFHFSQLANLETDTPSWRQQVRANLALRQLW